jgi:hypothetical protein
LANTITRIACLLVRAGRSGLASGRRTELPEIDTAAQISFSKTGANPDPQPPQTPFHHRLFRSMMAAWMS